MKKAVVALLLIVGLLMNSAQAIIQSKFAPTNDQIKDAYANAAKLLCGSEESVLWKIGFVTGFCANLFSDNNLNEKIAGNAIGLGLLTSLVVERKIGFDFALQQEQKITINGFDLDSVHGQIPASYSEEKVLNPKFIKNFIVTSNYAYGAHAMTAYIAGGIAGALVRKAGLYVYNTAVDYYKTNYSNKK